MKYAIPLWVETCSYAFVAGVVVYIFSLFVNAPVDDAPPEGQDRAQECWDFHEDLMDRLQEVDSPYVMPCVNCVLARSETPRCDNLCGPAPHVGLTEILEGIETP